MLLFGGLVNCVYQGGGVGWGSNAKERDSPYFRSPEAGISEFGKRLYLHYVTLLLTTAIFSCPELN